MGHGRVPQHKLALTCHQLEGTSQGPVVNGELSPSPMNGLASENVQHIQRCSFLRKLGLSSKVSFINSLQIPLCYSYPCLLGTWGVWQRGHNVSEWKAREWLLEQLSEGIEIHDEASCCISELGQFVQMRDVSLFWMRLAVEDWSQEWYQGGNFLPLPCVYVLNCIICQVASICLQAIFTTF